ncbi:MAG: hypothetical protein MN733_42070 [Nitrososphaera sp.]|nr:hypothetical protein [Nitrososphaera sp.]
MSHTKLPVDWMDLPHTSALLVTMRRGEAALPLGPMIVGHGPDLLLSAVSYEISLQRRELHRVKRETGL